MISDTEVWKLGDGRPYARGAWGPWYADPSFWPRPGSPELPPLPPAPQSSPFPSRPQQPPLNAEQMGILAPLLNGGMPKAVPPMRPSEGPAPQSSAAAGGIDPRILGILSQYLGSMSYGGPR